MKNNDLELIYKFAKKHRLGFHFYEDFEGNYVNAFIVVDDEVFDYTYYENEENCEKRIQFCDEVRSDLSVETALRYFEDELLLKGELK